MISTILLCVLITSVLFVMRGRRRTAQVNDEVPICVYSLPIIGVTHLFLTNNFKLWENLKMIFADTVRQGGVMKFKLGFNYLYTITDLEDATTIANSCLDKSYLYKFVECWLGQSLLTAPATKWKRNRKLLNPAFSLPMMHGFMTIFNDQAKDLIADMDNHAEKGPFEATSYIHNHLLRGTCLSTFGSSNLHNKEKDLKKYLSAICKITEVIIQRVQKFWQHSDVVYNLCKAKKKQDELVNTLKNFSKGIIHNAKSAKINEHTDNGTFSDQKAGFRSFMDMYLQINANNNYFSSEELREELELTIAAAFDTTVNQFETILIVLGSFPEIQERVFNEIIQVIGKERDVYKEDLQKLAYTDAVIKEIMRFRPVTPVVARHVDHDVKLKNYTLYKGTAAFIVLDAINHDASWGPDADQFRPERWLEPGGVPATASAFATFSIGKRSCIGKTYALISIKVAVAHIVRKYHIRADHTKVQFKFEVLLKPVIGNQISLSRRIDE